MLKACKYCGKIHRKDYQCEKKPSYIRIRNSDVDKFRNTQLWINKRDYIKQRDKYLCQACLHNLYGTTKRLNTDMLEVHHIVPIKSAWDLRLEDNNLITLCRYHHELAEKGDIKPLQLKELLRKTSPLPLKR